MVKLDSRVLAGLEKQMPWFDLPLERLREFRTETIEPPELDRWWQLRLDEASKQARPPELTRYEADIYGPVEVYDAEFSGAGGDRIKAWYLQPAGANGQTPVVVKFIGYGGGRGLPTEHTLLPALGYSVFVMDTRGQGGRWTSGATGDHPAGPAGGPMGGPAGGPENAQVMSRGIGRPEDYYYTRLFTDAVRAVETACELTGARRVAVSGGSQGGGLALAAAALVPRAVAVCHADVPFLCDIQRAITLAPDPPYTEVPEFLAHNVDLIPAALDTLRYVDCALLARRITARCLLSVGLMDTICPPSTVFAAYNEITAGKDISVYPFTGHAVPAAHAERQLRHFRDFLLGADPAPPAGQPERQPAGS
jgi:cephalosporin-C deacetylase